MRLVEFVFLAFLSSGLFFYVDAEGFHLSVEVGAFQAQSFCGAGDVAVALV
jgi:hypothetical protein